MFDVFYTASTISNDWPEVVGKLPKALTEAIDAFDAVRVVEEPYTGFDASEVTAKNASETVTKLAADLVVASQFDEAQRRVSGALAGRILRTAGAVVPEVIDSLRPAFDKAVAEFADAVSELPDDVSSDALVAAGPAVLADYHRALAAQADIARIDRWLDSLVNLPAFAGQPHEPATRVLNPLNRSQFHALGNAASSSDQLGQLNPIYVAAVREKIEFELHDPAEAASIRQEIEAQPVVRKQLQFLKINA
jgi:hypothetical protein